MQTVTETKVLFTNYADLLKATEGHQLTAQEIVNCRTYLNGKGWSEIEISDELREQFCKEVAHLLGGRMTTRAHIENNLFYGRPQHWGLSRIFFCSRNGKIGITYCAGQDYTRELQQIRNAIK